MFSRLLAWVVIPKLTFLSSGSSFLASVSSPSWAYSSTLTLGILFVLFSLGVTNISCFTHILLVPKLHTQSMSCSQGRLHMSVNTMNCFPSVTHHSILYLLCHGLTWSPYSRFLCLCTSHLLSDFFVWTLYSWSMCITECGAAPSPLPTRCH